MFYAVQNGDVYDLRFKYDPQLISLVKNVPGRRYIPEGKYWTIPTPHLGFLINEIKGTPYEKALQIQSEESLNQNETLDPTTEIPDVDISDIDIYVKEGSTLYAHQLAFLKYAKSKGKGGFILADDMGCIAGDAIVTVNVGGGSRKMTLSKLYDRFNKLTPNARKETHDFFVRCYKPDLGIFALNKAVAVNYSGIKPVYRLTLSDGKTIKATADHEILTDKGFVELQNLNVGDTVIVNGIPKCKKCGSTYKLITYPGAKFCGYCMRCMYKLRDGAKYKGDETGKYIDKDGYVVLKGKPYREHPNYNNAGVLEHHYVMSQKIGRGIAPNEVVHHIDGNKRNNDISNLQLMTAEEHAKLHSQEKVKHLWHDYYNRGNLIIMTPKESKVVSVEYVGEEDTYDIIMAEPYRNFIANGIVVHNCGKTLETINYAYYQRKKYGYKHCLIIACVNAAKYSWQDDIAKHTNGQEQGYILGSWVVSRGKNKGQIRYNGSGEDKVNDLKLGKMYGKEDGEDLPYFIITNIESLGRTKVGKKFTLEEELLKMADRGELAMVVVDECHKNMSPQSTQGKVILDMKKRDVNKKIQWIPMTGTPIKNKPTDVFTPLKLVDGHAFKSFYEWSHKFCIYGGFGGYEILGYRNIPLLKDMLQGNMIRRVKEEVLDLPPKIRMIEYVENTAYQSKLYDEISEEIYEKRDEILGSMNPLAHMLRLRQVNGSPELVDDSLLPLVNSEEYLKYNAKLARLIELVDDIVERGEKVIIFSNWVEPLRTAYKFLSKRHKTCCYTGSMSEADREKHRRVFVNNPDYPVMVGTIGAMGVSITLTVATNVIFYDDCWTPSDKEQAEDRCRRIGTTKSINVYTLVAKGTIDEYVYKILENKRAIAKYIVDGQLDLKKNPELFEFLLGKKAIETANDV